DMTRPTQDRRIYRTGIAAFAALLVGWSPAPAQEAGDEQQGAERANAPVEVVDRVAAVVGDTVVLYSEILESLLQAQAEGRDIPPEGTPAFDSLMSGTLNSMIDQLVLLQRAQEEDISISEDVVEAETDRRFQEVRNSFSSASEFNQAIEESGRTLVQYRLYLRSQVRAQLMIERFVQQRSGSLPPVTVSDDEVREFFEENLSGQSRPPTVSFEQVVIRPTPSEEAEAEALESIEEVVAELHDGMEFEVAARRYSEDPATRDDGGDLGWVRRSGIDPDFADAAWAARTGTPVGPVRTQFGYHVIKVDNVRGGERKIRHILVRPEIGQNDVARARELAEAVADSARDGVDMEHLARNHGLDDEPVRLPDVAFDRLSQGGYGDYLQHLQAPVPGEIVGPFETNVRGRRFVVLKILEFSPRGQLEFEDVREDLRRELREQKGITGLVQRLRTEVYVDVRL
ncbi:MAG: peptidylprolyl isomerase, partial [Gemmatimonadota bacterium]